MKPRLLIRPLFLLLVAPFVDGQQMCSGGGESAPPASAVVSANVPVASAGCSPMTTKVNGSADLDSRVVTEIPTRVEVMRRIAVYEAALRRPESARADDATVAKAYSRLASLYEDVAMYERSETALEHAISLLRRDAELSGQLAENIDNLGLLHGEMGKLRQAEREELEALSLREKLGNSLGIARSWNALSGIYFKEREFAISREFAQRALDEFSVDKQADVADRISARLNLAVAMCYMKECPSAVPVLKDTVAIAKVAFKPNDFPVGDGEFLLGFAYWKSGEISLASDFMEQGVAIMKGQLGWGHPAYINALSQYARFLRESRRVEDAEVVERQIRQAESVVDARSIATRGGADSLAGLQ